MPPKKGFPSNNLLGRPAGIPNKVTADVRLALEKALSGHIRSLGRLLEELEPKDRVDAISKLLNYIIPRYSDFRVDVSGTIHLEKKDREDLNTLDDLKLSSEEIEAAEFADLGDLILPERGE